MEDYNGQVDTPTAKDKKYRKSKSSLSISALFHGHLHRRHEPAAEPPSPPAPEPPSSPKANHSRWIWHRHHNDHHHHHHHHAPEIKGKSRNVISRKGHHRRHTSDLSYDPLSYSQNFERDEAGDDNDNPLRNSFTARLKAAEKGEEMEAPPAASKEGKITRRKSFDLNDLMNMAKILEDGQPIQN